MSGYVRKSIVNVRHRFVTNINVRDTFDYTIQKRFFDLFLSVFLLALMLPIAVILFVINPLFNKGPLFFLQERMGQDCQPFTAWKFRSMTVVADKHSGTGSRGPFDPLDRDRITPLGNFLRKSRIDELPQVVNIFRGEMSLIGPRHDAYRHALTYVDEVPGYRERCSVLPGITGLAQITVGYVEGREGLDQKVNADLRYRNRASMWLDLWITKRTVGIVLGLRGL